MSLFAIPSASVTDDLYTGSLPSNVCDVCSAVIHRREQRVYVRATWRPATDVLCAACWRIICEWAGRFALTQMELPIPPDVATLRAVREEHRKRPRPPA